jgi:hypothetical protein
MATAPFDPWRHLALIESIRAGEGFSLYEGQPFIWYSPIWHYLCAWFPPSIKPEWIAGFLSILSVVLFYLWLRCRLGCDSSAAAATGTAMFSLFGPTVQYTCHNGSESLALFLGLGALCLSEWKPSPRGALLSGLLLGLAVVLRASFLWTAIVIVLRLSKDRRAIMTFLLAWAVPLGVSWWRNHLAIADHSYLFTWDGIATKTSEFSWLSTSVVQLHPTINEGLRRLHEAIMPRPEWLTSWGLLSFMILSHLMVVASRQVDFGIVTVAALAFFAFFDSTLSSNFFRIWLAVFPVYFASFAVASFRIGKRCSRKMFVSLTLLSVIGVVLTGARFLKPVLITWEKFLPPEELIAEEKYLVNSAAWHPEILVHHFPEKSFIGLPIFAEEVEEFLVQFREYRLVLWHEGGVQEEVRRYLYERRGTRIVSRGESRYGLGYIVMELPDQGH